MQIVILVDWNDNYFNWKIMSHYYVKVYEKDGAGGAHTPIFKVGGTSIFVSLTFRKILVM